jgi:hypothetical protein
MPWGHQTTALEWKLNKAITPTAQAQWRAARIAGVTHHNNDVHERGMLHPER